MKRTLEWGGPHGPRTIAEAPSRLCCTRASTRIPRFPRPETGCLSSSSASITAPHRSTCANAWFSSRRACPMRCASSRLPRRDRGGGDRLDLQPHRALLRHGVRRGRARRLAAALPPARRRASATASTTSTTCAPSRTCSRSPPASTRWSSASRRSSASSRTPTARRRRRGTTGPLLNRLFQAAFSVAKRVRTETAIGANAVSVASAAVAWRKTVFASFENRTALLVGAGETIELAARHLHADGLRRMIIANRSIERARRSWRPSSRASRSASTTSPRTCARPTSSSPPPRARTPIITRDDGRRRAARAQAPPDLHGRHRRAARHRARRSPSSRTSTSSPSTTCSPS